jgi:putative FmdB family regulatory protein
LRLISFTSRAAMPTYEYQCREGHRFDKFQKMTEKPRAKCPVCGKPATRKISGGAGLVFKGSGFYITDYGKDGKGPRKPETESAPASEAKPSESKPEKSETKASSKPEAAPGKSSSRQTKGKAASE